MMLIRSGGGLKGLAAVFLVCLITAAEPLARQKGEGRKPVPELDPYTQGKPSAMAKAGYVDFRPVHFVGTQTSEELRQVLGGVPTLFLETAHFKIASTLDEYDLGDNDVDRDKLRSALSLLKKRVPKVNPRTRVLDPWLRLHLYAAMLEDTYAQFVTSFGLEERFGPDATPGDEGFYLGMREKFCVLLTDKRSELGRYSLSSCRMQSEIQVQEVFEKEGCLLLGVSFEGIQSVEANMRYMVVYGMIQTFLMGYGGVTYYGGAFWLAGLARWFARQGNEDLIVYFDPPQAVVERREKDTQWRRKVRARVEQDYYLSARDLLAFSSELDMKLNEHMMLWSRMDFLMSLELEKRQAMLEAMSKPLPWLKDKEAYLPQFQQRFTSALQEAYGMDLDAFDTAWLVYVTSNYPRR